MGELHALVQQLHPILLQSTSNRWNSPIEQTSSGINPVRPGLLDKINVDNADKLPMSLGMEPVSLFEERDKNSESRG